MAQLAARGRESTVAWTAPEAHHLVRAVRHAPIWSARRPWVLELLPGRAAALYVVPGQDGPDRDGGPAGRDRLLSCGAALTNLRTALRGIGWRPDVELVDDPSQPDRLATVRAGRPYHPTAADRAMDAATTGARRPGPKCAPPRVADRLSAAVWSPGTELRALAEPDQADVLARIIAYAAHRDRDQVPAIAGRLATGLVFVVITTDDARRDHVLAGAAVQAACLAAAVLDLVGIPVITLLHLPEVRSALIESLGLAGYPQALFCVVRPADIRIPRPRGVRVP